MTFFILTIFPNIIESYINESIIKRAIQKGLLQIKIMNIRDFAEDKHAQVDDYPYGGGAGMVMKPEPIYYAFDFINADGIKRHSILLSPQGKVHSQEKAEEILNKKKDIILLCGRYEGIDERIMYLIDEEISVGDYILTGGELPALIIIDSVVRLIPGVLGDERSKEEESFSSGLLDYPQYTRPADFNEMNVPDVLISGNHQKIKRWRRKEAFRKTLIKKPYMISKANLTEEDNKILKELKEEMGK